MRTQLSVPGLVSVVIPAFNRMGLLKQAIESTREQTYPQWELVIVDDGSGRETREELASLMADDADRMRVITQENSGPGAAREAGRRVARGEFLQFLDSDDVILPRKLEIQVASLRNEPVAAVSYGVTGERLTDGSLRVPVRRTGDALTTLFPHLLAGRLWHTATPLYRASVCEEAGGWSDLRFDEDWEFEARIGALGVALVYVDELVAEHRFHSQGHAGAAAAVDPARLRQQATAHESILKCATLAEVAVESTEMQTYSRFLFALARRCGAAGLALESHHLFEQARKAAGPRRSTGLDFRAYRAFAAVLGWNLAGCLAVASDGWAAALRRRPSRVPSRFKSAT